jgi:hypothetical protein
MRSLKRHADTRIPIQLPGMGMTVKKIKKKKKKKA